ncbi:hypothetical protein [Microcoleus sp. herbarium12]
MKNRQCDRTVALLGKSYSRLQIYGVHSTVMYKLGLSGVRR